MADEVKALWGQYLSSLQRHPLRTKAITAGVLAGSADVVAQKLAGVKKLHFSRSLLIMMYGFCYSGPFGHFFHKLMEKLFPSARDTKTVASKIHHMYIELSGGTAVVVHLGRLLGIHDATETLVSE